MGLITNAIEATSRGGRVTVRTQVLGNNGKVHAVGVSIEDTGEGIPVENRERVFEPFFTTKPHGTGIGLPLAKKFVERNGGTIALSETATVGTTINLTLPCTKSDSEMRYAASERLIRWRYVAWIDRCKSAAAVAKSGISIRTIFAALRSAFTLAGS